MKLLAAADCLLRDRPSDRPLAPLPLSQLIWLLACGGFAYGVIMGSGSGRPLQALYSGLKVPILLTASSLVCLPNFFVVNTLLGLREDFPRVLRGLLSTQTTVALVLASLAPLTAVAYLSSADYHFAIVWNGAMFLAASIASQLQLGRIYRPLIAARPRHRICKSIWLALYIFVTIQLAWMLRPFVGSPGLETAFFRQGVWDNAFVVVINDVWTLFTK